MTIGCTRPDHRLYPVMNCISYVSLWSINSSYWSLLSYSGWNEWNGLKNAKPNRIMADTAVSNSSWQCGWFTSSNPSYSRQKEFATHIFFNLIAYS